MTPREIGIFPALRSLVILGFFFFVIPRLKQDRHVGYLLVGILATIVSLVMLVSRRFAGSSWFRCRRSWRRSGPRSSRRTSKGFVTAIVDPHHRARILAVANTVVLAVASPFGWIAGVLSAQAKGLPFVLAGAAMAVTLVVLLVGNPERGGRG